MKNVAEHNYALKNLEQLSLEDLKTLEARARELIEQRVAERRKEALRELEQRASQLGFNLFELVNDARPKKLHTKHPESDNRRQVFAHPDDPNLTWSGRGRHPLWFKRLLRDGVDPETLLVGLHEN